MKIETPGGYGTGFLALYNQDRTICGIATAAHVIAHAEEWQEPIRIRHAESKDPVFLKASERVIYADWVADSAVVLFLKRDLKLPERPIDLLPVETPCRIGVDIGWLGYPVIERYTLCFFSGAVSARQANKGAYLIDGVAINGVSGGPVFHCHNSSVQIIGCVSAYQANRATGETLPGLLRAQDVSHFHEIAKYVQSLDEARNKKKEFEETQKKTQNPELSVNQKPSAGTAISTT